MSGNVEIGVVQRIVELGTDVQPVSVRQSEFLVERQINRLLEQSFQPRARSIAELERLRIPKALVSNQRVNERSPEDSAGLPSLMAAITRGEGIGCVRERSYRERCPRLYRRECAHLPTTGHGIKEWVPFERANFIENADYGPMWYISTAERLIQTAAVSVHIALRIAILVRGSYIVQELRPRVVCEKRKSPAESFFC